jgi:hypothetical protein
MAAGRVAPGDARSDAIFTAYDSYVLKLLAAATRACDGLPGVS